MIVEILLLAILAVLLFLVYKSISRTGEARVPEGFDLLIGDVGMKHGVVLAELGKLSATVDERMKQHSEAQKSYQEKVDNSLSGITRALSGTRRGGAGEAVLKEILNSPIRTGLVVTDLEVGTKRVEFAWNVGYGKYIPIDAKLPEVEDLYDRYVKSDNTEEQKRIKSEIMKRLKRQIEEVKKYKNSGNTFDKCILAIPDGLIEVFPEMSMEIERSGIAVCGYSSVFFHAYHLADAYRRTREKGDIGELQQAIRELLGLMKEISDSSITIDRGLTMIDNANRQIRNKVTQSEKHGKADIDKNLRQEEQTN